MKSEFQKKMFLRFRKKNSIFRTFFGVYLAGKKKTNEAILIILV